MRRIWATRRPGIPLRLLLLPLDLVALGYGAAARLHRALYQRGWLSRRRLSCQVVSVGGLAVGGSGKTPAAAWLAAALHRRGQRVVIATRGYGRRGREPVEVVSDGHRIRSSAARAGDEPMLLAAHAPGVPVLVGPDRGLAGLRAVSAFDCEVLVLDDGFQHHRLARDVDVLTVDGRLGFGAGRVLPRGPLREPLAALGCADAVLCVDGPVVEADEATLQRRAPDAFRLEGRRKPVGWRPLAGGSLRPVSGLAGLRVGTLAGIADPASLRATLERLGARVVAERSFPDHHRFRREDLARLDRHVPAWITTEKDAVKLPAAWAGGAEIHVLVIDLEVEREKEFLDWLEQRLRQRERDQRRR